MTVLLIINEWQPELQTIEHLSGTSGQPGAKTKLVYLHEKRKTEMIETINARNLSDEVSGTYEVKGVVNHMFNSFKRLGKN